MNISFQKILQKTLQRGGIYSNDPIDKGGETFKEISRAYWPEWSGWPLIDAYKNLPELIHNRPKLISELDNDELLKIRAESFYRKQFWNVINGDLLFEISPFLAELLFDIAVNQHPYSANKYLQKALNVMNRNGMNYGDIVEDGKMGPITLNTLADYLKITTNKIQHLFIWIFIFQGDHYYKYMKKSPVQERFARGWLNRMVDLFEVEVKTPNE